MRGFIILLLTISMHSWAQFDPAGGEAGSKSIHNDASSIIAWANAAQIRKGFVQINDTSLGKPTVGDSSSAIGPADGLVVSLGDGGEAILEFTDPILNKEGYDFAVFENGFKVGLSYYLELAHVEVSKDGIFYKRFPSETVTDTSYQIDDFGYLRPEEIYNLAGKHQSPYGTLFDLEEIGLDSVRFIKLIDVVGATDNWGSRDSKGKIINDPFPSPFESGGFDLDAVAVVNGQLLQVEEVAKNNACLLYSKIAANEEVRLTESADVEVFDALGKTIFSGRVNTFSVAQSGIYNVKISRNAVTSIEKLCVY